MKFALGAHYKANLLYNIFILIFHLYTLKNIRFFRVLSKKFRFRAVLPLLF